MTAALLSRTTSWAHRVQKFLPSVVPTVHFPCHQKQQLRQQRIMSHSVDGSRWESLLPALRALDTAAICDADKGMFSKDNINDGNREYKGIKVLPPSLRPIHPQQLNTITGAHNISGTTTMVGWAKTVQCTQRNDFLAVLRGLMEVTTTESNNQDVVLVVDTCGSDRAVAGELFCLQALGYCRMAGMVVDGPVRDTIHVQNNILQQQKQPLFRMYATSVTPYSGTIQSPGCTDVSVTLSGGIVVEPTDIIVGDNDGVIAADADTLEQLLPDAQAIFDLEARVKEKLLKGEENLASMTNYDDHLAARLAGKPSSLGFKV